MKVSPFVKPLKNRQRIWLRYTLENKRKEYEKTDFYLYNNGKGVKDKEAWASALRLAKQREGQIISGNYGSEVVRNNKKSLSLFKFLDIYEENYTKKDLRMIRYCIQKFKDFREHKDLQLGELTNVIVNKYADYLKNRAALSGETPNNYLSRFKKILKDAVRRNMLSIKVLEDVSIKAPRNSLKKQVLTIDELKKLKNVYWGNEEVKNAFLFACFSGLGFAEIIKLKWDSILFDEKKLITYRAKTDEQVNNDLHQTAIEILKIQKEKNTRFIFNLKSNNATQKVLKNAVKKAEIEKNISFYCGRHTFAVNLLLNGANLKTVADCLGHTTTTHTLKYLNFVDSLKKKAINSIPPI